MERGQLVRPRTLVVPTWRGGLLLLVSCGLLAGIAIRTVHPFLAVTDRVPARVLVIEGWIPDRALRAGLEEFRRGGYRELLLTGGPLESGAPLSEFGSFAELARATLVRMGAPAEVLHAVPAPAVQRDRTFASAVALRDWLRRQGRSSEPFNVVSDDVHARRTRALFERAFGGRAEIGIIAVPDPRFDGASWWRSSQGFRTVTDEVIGYLYASVFAWFASDLAEP